MLYKKLRKKRKFRFRILIILTAVILLIVLFEMYMQPFQDKVMENRAKVIVEDRVSEIANSVIESSDYNYDKLLVKSVGSDDKVTSLSVDSQAVNKLQNEFSDVFQNKMDDLITSTFSVPIGDFTNLTMLSSMGPRITFTYDMTGSVSVELKSDFTSTGMNQTLHRLTMVVDAEIVFISQSYMENMNIRNEFAVAETVIVGNTPNYLYPRG